MQDQQSLGEYDTQTQKAATGWKNHKRKQQIIGVEHLHANRKVNDRRKRFFLGRDDKLLSTTNAFKNGSNTFIFIY